MPSCFFTSKLLVAHAFICSFLCLELQGEAECWYPLHTPPSRRETVRKCISRCGLIDPIYEVKKTLNIKVMKNTVSGAFSITQKRREITQSLQLSESEHINNKCCLVFSQDIISNLSVFVNALRIHSSVLNPTIYHDHPPKAASSHLH